MKKTSPGACSSVSRRCSRCPPTGRLRLPPKSFEPTAAPRNCRRADPGGLQVALCVRGCDPLAALTRPRWEGSREDVEIGQAEALLIGNLVRSLLLYLGSRPQID